MCAYLQMYRSKSFKMKRLGALKAVSGGVGNPVHIVALDVSVQVWDGILRGLLLGLLLLVADHGG
jgi:hypothetical protein